MLKNCLKRQPVHSKILLQSQKFNLFLSAQLSYTQVLLTPFISPYTFIIFLHHQSYCAMFLCKVFQDRLQYQHWHNSEKAAKLSLISFLYRYHLVFVSKVHTQLNSRPRWEILPRKNRFGVFLQWFSMLQKNLLKHNIHWSYKWIKHLLLVTENFSCPDRDVTTICLEREMEKFTGNSLHWINNFRKKRKKRPNCQNNEDVESSESESELSMYEKGQFCLCYNEKEYSHKGTSSVLTLTPTTWNG